MTTRCNRCGRWMRRQSASGYGPKCELAILGTKPRRIAREDRKSDDPRQLALEWMTA